VEVHPQPEVALSDGDQSLTFNGFVEMMNNLRGPLRQIHAPRELAVCA
jgi:3-deoxy-7-phosphoheptulonate synthase